MGNAEVISTLTQAKVNIDDAIAQLQAQDATAPPPAENVIDVKPGDNLRAIIDAAPEGAVLSIAPDYVTEIGVMSLKKPITLQSAGELGPARVTAALVGPQLLKGSVTFAAPGIVWRGVRLEGQGQTMIIAGPSMLLDRCVLLAAAGQQQHRGVLGDAPDIVISGSHIGGIYKDVDTQAVGCFRKTKRLRIIDSLLEASGENFMAGGADPASEADTPEDILIERCTLSKPEAWKTLNSCVVKNLFELKNAKRVILRGCKLEYNWAHGQGGNAVVLSVRNQDGRAPWSTIEDVLIEDNAIAHVGGGFGILGRDDTPNKPSGIMSRVTIRRNTIEDLSTDWQRGSALATGRQYNISGGPIDLVFEDNNTMIAPGKVKAAMLFEQLQHLCTGLVFRRCSMHEGSYGIMGTVPNVGIGEPQLAGHAPGYVWEACTIQRGNSGRKVPYPPDTTVLAPVGPIVRDDDPDRLDTPGIYDW